MSDRTVHEKPQSGWARFWNRGAWWKAVLLAVAYFAVYQLLSLAVLPLVPFAGASTSPSFVLVFYAIPVALGALVLVVFGASVGWLRPLFARQPLTGKGWMWIAVAVVLVFNVLHLASIDYATAGLDLVFTWLLTGLFIGFAEEVLTRGYVVNIMRAAGYREITVALVSAGTFALLHAGNLLSGQALIPTLFQLVYTFFFGICVYLALRVTGTIIAPILLHASTDPSIFLHTQFPVASTVGSLASVGNIAVIVVGLVLVFFIRGRVAQADDGAVGLR